MVRGRKPRSWVKIDCGGLLRGSINWQLTLEEQAVWIKMIAYSEVCGGNPGMICDNDSRPLPHQFIAEELHCPVSVFESTLKKCKIEGRVEENSSGISLVNFDAYQFTEYDRQRIYRQGKSDQVSKDIKAQGAVAFDEFVKSLIPEYPALDVANELTKFKLWWGESGRELKRPKVAFKNWLDKAVKIQREGELKDGANRANPRKVREHDKFTTPEENREKAG